MSETIRKHGPIEPSEWVSRWLAGVRPGGRILDVACGRGRHMRLALERGLLVTGVDRDLSAVSDLSCRAGVELCAADLETGALAPFAGRQFDGIVVTNYLFRPLMPAIVAAVKGDGLLIYETFAIGNERLGAGPSNPNFLLRPNELVQYIVPHLQLIAFEHGLVTCRVERNAQRIIAVGHGHPWVDAPPRLD